MRHYEIVFLVHPDRSEQVPAMIGRYKEMVASGSGLTHRVEDWGRRRLAYMINEVHKAHYVMLNIECDLSVLAEIERHFKFNDSILRHLVLRRKQAETGESPMAAAKAKEDAEEAAKLAREAERRKNAEERREQMAADGEQRTEDGEQERPETDAAAAAEPGQDDGGETAAGAAGEAVSEPGQDRDDHQPQAAADAAGAEEKQ